MSLMTALAVSSALGSTGSEQSMGISSGVITRKTPILAAVGACPQSVLVNPEPTVRRATSWPRTNAEQGANAQAADGDSAAEKAVESRGRQMRQLPMSCAATADTALPRPCHALPPPMHHTLAVTLSVTTLLPSLRVHHVLVTGSRPVSCFNGGQHELGGVRLGPGGSYGRRAVQVCGR
jgi:hypothetical protein